MNAAFLADPLVPWVLLSILGVALLVLALVLKLGKKPEEPRP